MKGAWEFHILSNTQQPAQVRSGGFYPFTALPPDQGRHDMIHSREVVTRLRTKTEAGGGGNASRGEQMFGGLPLDKK